MYCECIQWKTCFDCRLSSIKNGIHHFYDIFQCSFIHSFNWYINRMHMNIYFVPFSMHHVAHIRILLNQPKNNNNNSNSDDNIDCSIAFAYMHLCKLHHTEHFAWNMPCRKSIVSKLNFWVTWWCFSHGITFVCGYFD